MENDWWLLILRNHSQCTTSTSLMKNGSMVKKILKILSEKKVYYIFLFLKVSQCKFKQKETILKLENPIKSKSKFTKSKIGWGAFPLHPLPGFYPEPTGGLLTLARIFSPSIILKSPLSKFVVKTLSNISVILWRSVLLMEETSVPRENLPTCRRSLTNFITVCCIEYTSPWTGFKLTTLV